VCRPAICKFHSVHAAEGCNVSAYTLEPLNGTSDTVCIILESHVSRKMNASMRITNIYLFLDASKPSCGAKLSVLYC
jgi:hypothetical protein